MKLVGMCGDRGTSEYSIRIGGAPEMEKRLGVDLVAWLIGDGPLNLNEIRVLRRRVSPEEVEQADKIFLPHAVVTMQANMHVVGPGEDLLAKAGSTRWELAEPMTYASSDDAELKSMSAIMAAQSDRPERDLLVVSTPVTVETFHKGDLSPVAPSKIGEAEKRLGVKLPALLRELYARHGGGYVPDLCIPKRGITDHSKYEDIIHPFIGYNSLSEVDNLRTAYDSFLDFGDPGDKETYGSFF